ncbi:hypothetical protein [Lacrimispora amygdalina]|uniref:hypothetical protein n=1 Tax=Lacrimispora amygdalina TaxID=253257 RepID=UPI000BE416EB|nr:hypothetical protein [Lacrimispora amygdalina]
MAEQNEMLEIVTPMVEHVCDHLCRFPGEISDQEELDKICGGCQMGDHICSILNTYNWVNSSGIEILQGQAVHENMVAYWKWHLTERFSRVV